VRVPSPLRLVCGSGALRPPPLRLVCGGGRSVYVWVPDSYRYPGRCYFRPSIAFFAPGCRGTGSVLSAFSSLMPLAAAFTATSASMLS